MCYKLLNQYLDIVLQAGLIENGKNNYFIITTKGQDFLAKFNIYNETRDKAFQNLNQVKVQRLNLEDMCS